MIETDQYDFVDEAKPRRGRPPKVPTKEPQTSEEGRVIVALIYLRRGMRPEQVAIQENVRLQIGLVKELAAALNVVSAQRVTKKRSSGVGGQLSSTV
jgi:hypothetical protein